MLPFSSSLCFHKYSLYIEGTAPVAGNICLEVPPPCHTALHSGRVTHSTARSAKTPVGRAGQDSPGREGRPAGNLSPGLSCFALPLAICVFADKDFVGQTVSKTAKTNDEKNCPPLFLPSCQVPLFNICVVVLFTFTKPVLRPRVARSASRVSPAGKRPCAQPQFDHF